MLSEVVREGEAKDGSLEGGSGGGGASSGPGAGGQNAGQYRYYGTPQEGARVSAGEESTELSSVVYRWIL